MNVVEHRPPLKRIEIGSKPRNKPQIDMGEFGTYSPAEVDRIWKITRQVAEGVNAPGEPQVDSSGWDAA